MKVAEKKKVNKAVGVVVDPTYFNEIPLADIMEAIEGFGYLVVDEEHNRWSGFWCGREGQAMFDILSKETGSRTTRTSCFPGTRCLPGGTRFWLMWPETLNKGQELRFLSLLERLWLKSEIRRQGDGSGHHAISGQQRSAAQRIWALGVSSRQRNAFHCRPIWVCQARRFQNCPGPGRRAGCGIAGKKLNPPGRKL